MKERTMLYIRPWLLAFSRFATDMAHTSARFQGKLFDLHALFLKYSCQM